MRPINSGLALLILCLGCDHSSTNSTTTPTAPASSGLTNSSRADDLRAIALDSFKALSGRLKAAMAEGGVAKAVAVCKVEAPAITTRLAKKQRVRSIRRTALRVRNPANRPSAHEREILEEFARDLASKKRLHPRVEDGPDGRQVGYLPIILQPLCLFCHGDPNVNIKADDLKIIRELYPEDAAVGFDVGELRGMWVIEGPPRPR